VISIGERLKSLIRRGLRKEITVGEKGYKKKGVNQIGQKGGKCGGIRSLNKIADGGVPSLPRNN